MSTSSGKQAEALVANYLISIKHKILAMNWRTRRCEIDIVSTHKRTAYFTEVKFRSSSRWGYGLDYITEKKLSQMEFAAETWAAQHDWRGEMQLQAAAVDADGGIEIIEI